MGILDVFYPRSCCICGKKGYYLCDRCKKLLKRNLPECYACRRISNSYKTHIMCRNNAVFDSVFTGWEYNNMSSIFLKKYKFSGVYDINMLFDVLVPILIKDFCYVKDLQRTVVIPMPISQRRLRERGFNQTEYIAEILADEFHFDFANDIVQNNDLSNEHQSLKDKEDRCIVSMDKFSIEDKEKLNSYKNVIVVDDVITTGSTLNSIGRCIRQNSNELQSLHGFCLFRGKANYI
ncbi:MAG TPA: phosphoribosyltransferase family protein [Candidatus Dojkabacteria bacterium]|nr:phosphoribosyltransferase family protein [Candidatus Dojkabacteria bacterium]